ncbi:MAG: AI-2E family transporter [Gammaproteobacteria bacterium]|jgi:putative permease|nr:AI-2E family transporter [Gammaproteobacteria bacterium]
MINILRSWYERNFSDPQAVILLILLLSGFLVVIYMGSMLAPLLTSIVLAYMMEPVVTLLQKYRVPRLIAVIVVCVLFIVLAMLILLWLVPVLSNQITQLIQELPKHFEKGRHALLALPESYPQLFDEKQVNEIMVAISSQITGLGQKFLSFSLASIPVMFALVIYLFLVPLLIFFFLKDKHVILNWINRYLPKERGLAAKVWVEMDQQIGNYVRGKIAEIVIVGGASYVVFLAMGLNYSMLLAVLVGLSVIIPFIGAAAVTIPVVMIAYFQWGWSADFFYVVLAYSIVQAVDGNVLVPLLFSEAVNLHPVAIIAAVLVFGGLWGLWGVFFAIPLATLVKAVLSAWPTAQKQKKEVPEEEAAA